MKSATLVFASILAFFSCTSRTDENQSARTVTRAATAVETSAAPSTSDELVDYLPDSSYLADILVTGFLHGDEVEDDAARKKWFAIFESKKRVYLAQTAITTTKVFDVIEDEDSLTDKTGWLVETVNKDAAILLISGLDFLINREIRPVKLRTNAVLPGDSLTFKYLTDRYTLFATGIKQRDPSDPKSFQVSNYKLFISTVRNGKVLTDLLVTEKSFEETMISILFAGDIDGDGRLDLLIDTSNHYNLVRPTLYLSKPAAKGKMLKLVGMHLSIGC